MLCEDLSISGINTAGIPDNIMKTLILDIKFNKDYFERVIHHEVFHIINDQHKELFNESEWIKFNASNFKYSECSTCTEKLGLNTYNKTKGFFTEYSKATASEDMAEVYSHLIFLNTEKINQIRKSDIILNKKISYIENLTRNYTLYDNPDITTYEPITDTLVLEKITKMRLTNNKMGQIVFSKMILIVFYN